MAFDFDQRIERRGTGSEKWIKYEKSDILPMWVADMDFASPPAVIEALHRRVDHGIFGYAQPTTGVIEAVCRWCSDRYGWEIDPAWIVWLSGMVPGLHVACRIAGEPGDAVMTAAPIYHYFLSAGRSMDRETIRVPLQCREGRWSIDWELLEQAWTPRTRLFLLCHPHNPIGQVFPVDELRRLARFCVERDMILCSDDIHCDLILDDIPHRPVVMVEPSVASRTITLMAPSKTFNIPGLGCAFAIISDADLRARFKRAAHGIVPQVTALGFTGCEAAYSQGEPWRQELLAYLRRNRDRVEQFVRDELPGVSTTHLEATYLAWLNVEELGLADPVAHFEAAGVGLSDGRFFGTPGYVRLNFGCPAAMLEEALQRMRLALKA
jgi:cysteine-S-conjugate beta-lyase